MWLLSPLAWLLLAVLLAPLAWCMRGRAVWLSGCAALAVIAVAAMTPFAADSLVAYLERPVAEPMNCRAFPPSTLVVLAGGVDRLPRDSTDVSVMNIASRRRVEHAARQWRARVNVRLVLTGGPVAAGFVDNATLMSRYARMLGVPQQALRLESRARNTHENASYVARMVPQLPKRIGLVTSAMHMPRASATFRAAGFEVCPLPADFRAIPGRAPRNLVPHSAALVKTEAALREMAGVGVYRWRQWHEGLRNRVFTGSASCAGPRISGPGSWPVHTAECVTRH